MTDHIREDIRRSRLEWELYEASRQALMNSREGQRHKEEVADAAKAVARKARAAACPKRRKALRAEALRIRYEG